MCACTGAYVRVDGRYAERKRRTGGKGVLEYSRRAETDGGRMGGRGLARGVQRITAGSPAVVGAGGEGTRSDDRLLLLLRADPGAIACGGACESSAELSSQLFEDKFRLMRAGALSACCSLLGAACSGDAAAAATGSFAKAGVDAMGGAVSAAGAAGAACTLSELGLGGSTGLDVLGAEGAAGSGCKKHDSLRPS